MRLDLRLLDELNPVVILEVPHAAGGNAAIVGIVLEQRALAIFVDSFRPRLEGRDFIGIGDIVQQPIAVHEDGDAGVFDEYGRTGISPVSRFAGRGPKSRMTIGPARSGQADRFRPRLVRRYK